jgi:hypothetical protein
LVDGHFDIAEGVVDVRQNVLARLTGEAGEFQREVEGVYGLVCEGAVEADAL